jgi:ABC-2 type transport system ATP-binding protein
MTAATTQWAIEVEALQKTFGKPPEQVRALRGVSFQIPRGVVYTILGPNGAGKTTLMRILTTLTRPDAGRVLLEGYNLSSSREALLARHYIGVVFQENHFNRYLSIWQNLALHARLHGLRKAEYAPRLELLLSRVNLWDRRNALIEELSGGMQRRVALVRALIHRPSILFLDEPTTGLDPHARREIWHTILGLKRDENTTIILTTHYMEEADLLSDRILLLSQGNILREDTSAGLKQILEPPHEIEIVLVQPEAVALAQRIGEALGPDVVKNVHADRLRLHLPQEREDLWRAVLEMLSPEQVRSIGRVESSLEEVFLSMMASPSTESESEASR